MILIWRTGEKTDEHLAQFPTLQLDVLPARRREFRRQKPQQTAKYAKRRRFPLAAGALIHSGSERRERENVAALH